MREVLIQAHRDAFHVKPGVVVRAPGRVNLIGEHTDYNHGFVMPMAIDASIWVAVGPAERGRSLLGLDAPAGLERVEAMEDELRTRPERGWANYPLAAAWVLDLPASAAFHLSVCGDVPQGGGLSSSAALLVACVMSLARLFARELGPVDCVLAAQRAENEFIGLACGVMDHYASRACRAGHALLLDCRSLQAQHIPLDLGSRRLWIVDSGKRRGLVDSAYNQRRAECEQGVEILRRLHPGRHLRDFSLQDLEAARADMSDTVERRCRHVIEENRRVQAAAEQLRAGDLDGFARLLRQGHESLRDLYEVSCAEVDDLVQRVWDTPGVLGARMTGAGFGGAILVLLEEEAQPALRESLRRYEESSGLTTRILPGLPCAGAEFIPSDS